MKNPFCIIPTTLERMAITTIAVQRLSKQGINVVLVVSSEEELSYYTNLGIHATIAPNEPLGTKWQTGIDYARHFDPSHIIISGSDDIISNDFEKRFTDVDFFTGFKRWYIYSDGKLYLIDYLIEMPSGAARIYPKNLLDSIGWKLFKTDKNSLLDDYGWEAAKYFEHKLLYDPAILAVKGGWKVMNEFEAGGTIKIVETYEGLEAEKIMIEKFNYRPMKTPKEYYRTYIADDKANDLTLRIAEEVKSFSPNHVLEFGCGTGKNLIHFGCPVIGMDLSWGNIEIAKIRNHTPCVICADETYLRNLSNIDIVFTVSVLCHIEDIDGIVGELQRIANKAVFLGETNDVMNHYYFPHEYESLGFEKLDFEFTGENKAKYSIWKWTK